MVQKARGPRKYTSKKKTAPETPERIVIAVTPGKSKDGQLTTWGELQSERLGKRLRKLIPQGMDVSILVSPTHRTKHTGRIIALYFGKEIQICEELSGEWFRDGTSIHEALVWPAKFFPPNRPIALILVTHYRAPRGILNAFSLAHFGRPVRSGKTMRARGCMINLKTGGIKLDLFSDN